MTLEESKDYLKQQKELYDLHLAIPEKEILDGLHPVISEKSVSVAKILGFVGGEPTQENYINPPFVIKKDSLPGYILDKDLTVDAINNGGPFLHFFEVAVDPKIWPEVGEPRMRGAKGVIVHIVCLDSGDTAASSIFSLFDSRFHDRYAGQNIFKVPEGPGDKCLMGVGIMGIDYRLTSHPWAREHLGNLTIGDGGIYFVRGNVAIYLQSSIDSFGCLDLAKKLDAFLLEEAKRQAEESVKKSENPKSE